MKIEAFLADLSTLDIKLWAKGDKLHINAPESVMTEELRSQLRNRKAEILNFYKENQSWHSKAEELIPLFDRSNNAFPLSFAQERLWFLEQLEGKSATYNMPWAYGFTGRLNHEILQRALVALVERHESLRACFPMIDQEAVVQLNEVYNPLNITDLRGLSRIEQQNKVTRWIESHAQTPFDVCEGPLLRLNLLQLDQEEHVLQINIHHIISDGQSMLIFFQELSQLYNAYIQNREIHLPPLSIQYTDYAAWQKNWLDGTALEQQLSYWKDKLHDAPELLELPTDFPRPPVMRYKGKKIQSIVHPELLLSLKKMSHTNGVTLFITLLSAFNLLLYRYSGKSDLVVGSPNSNRPPHQADNLIGFFVNTLVFRNQIHGKQTFSELLKQIKQNAFEAYSHQDIPFSYLVEQLNPSRNLSRSPLFQVMFVLQNAPENALDLNGLHISSMEPENKTAKTDLNLSVFEQNNELICDWEYNTDLFRQETITRMSEHFQVLLEGIVRTPQELISKLPIVTNWETQQFQKWNHTNADYPGDRTLVDLFHEQVEKTPDNVAIIFDDGDSQPQPLTYSELNRKANQLAHYIATWGAGVETLAGICLDRSLEMVVAILAILKAGAAYVPLDPDYPRQRLQFMLDDSEAKVLITRSGFIDRFPEYGGPLICLDRDWMRICESSEENPYALCGPENLAYVTYTSGSTGQPKGVLGTHRGMINRLNWMWKTYPLETDEFCCHRSSINFIAHVAELFTPLLKGVPLVLISKNNMRDIFDLISTIHKYKIKRLDILPSLLRMILEQKDSQLQKLASMKYWFCSGEELPPDLARLFYEKLPNENLINIYGPSEVSADFTAYTVGNQQLHRVPIGKPIHNTQVYVLDENLKVVPVGVPGELHVSGVGLARGYLKRPELTESIFIETEVSGELQRLYKTGDLARLLPDGNLEYLGRLDHQIKLRGYRIELSEIEVTLGRHEEVKEAVVLLYNKKDNPQLVACITLTNDSVVDIAKVLRTWLKLRLPEYMLPARFTVLDKLPLAPNGKVDRKALMLPEMNVHAEHQPDIQQPPHTETEHLLCNLWSQVLDIDITSVQSNFFECGGHSLLGIRLVSRIRDIFEIEMPLRIIFEQKLLWEQASWIDSQKCPLPFPPISLKKKEQPLVLSFQQQRLWFLSQFVEQSTTYNMPLALHLTGQLDETALRYALQTIIKRHESLRLLFPMNNGEAAVRINDACNPLKSTDITILSDIQQQTSVSEWITDQGQIPFDLSCGPLLRLHLLKLGQHENILLFNIHHIISDIWSIGIFMRELGQLYNTHIKNGAANAPQLPELSIQYTDYALWQRSLLQGDILNVQSAYWMERLKGIPELLELPTDYSRPATMRYQGKHLQKTLDPEILSGIKQLSRQNSVTEFMTLLAAFKVLLYRYSEQTDLVVGTPVANRSRQETEDLIGLFVNTLIIRSEVKEEYTFLEFLKQVKQTAVEAYSHQEIPFETLVEQLNPSRSLSHTPLFQVMFAFQNTPEVKLHLHGVDISPMETDIRAAKYDVTLNMEVLDGKYVCDWEYNTDLFHPDTMARMSEHFQVLLCGILKNPEQLLTKLPLLTEEEHQQLTSWNQTQTHYPDDQTIVDLFHDRLAKVHDEVAIVFDDGEKQQHLSYRTLNASANKLAHYLISLGVHSETLVGICVERSLEMLIGLLAIVKAGGAYVPLDPEYPVQRLRFMLEDSEAKILLSQSHLIEQLSISADKIICLDKNWEQIEAYSDDNPLHRSGSKTLAYVMYTSGSTGKPKGVMIEHKALVNFLTDMQNRIQLKPSDNVLAITSLSFDIAALELYLPLLNGSRMTMVNQKIAANGEQLIQKIGEHEITTLQATPATYKLLIQNGWDLHRKKPLSILCGGEAMPVDLGQALLKNSRQLWNVYGPTETTIWSSIHDVTRFPERPELIGKPLANTRIYILDKNHCPTPPGSPGELCIAGDGLARGYLKRPELTDERFIEIEICGKKERLYKTGDSARFLLDGNLEYSGRLDHQIKLRGFRIELPEIEVTLCEYDAVSEAVVVLSEQGEDGTRLIAYVTLSMSIDRPAKILRTWLKSRIPRHMIPAPIIVLDSLPLTPNGKIDRQALAILSQEKSYTSDNFVEPQTDEEKKLANIWSDVLGVDQIGMEDNFFENGGHSLLATKLVSQIREVFAIELPLPELFELPTPSELITRIESLRNNGQKPFILSSIDHAPQHRYEPFPLTDIQHSSWLGRNGIPESGNVATHLYTEFDCENLDLSRLNRAWRQLIERHEMMRMIVLPTGQQQILEQVPDYTIECIDLRDMASESIAVQLENIRKEMSHKVLPADQWPLFEIKATQRTRAHIRIHFSFDALIADAWSMYILFNEWLQLYHNPNATLKPLTLSFRDYVVTEQTWRETSAYQKALQYWRKRLDTLPPPPQLPLVMNPSKLENPEFKQHRSRLEPEYWNRIKQRASKAGVTPSGVLLTAFTDIIAIWSIQPCFTINVTQFHRCSLVHEQINDVVGDFTSAILLAVDNSNPVKFTSRARTIQRQLWQDLEHRHVSAVKVQQELREKNPFGAMMPVVLTSKLTLDIKQNKDFFLPHQLGNIGYSISQTSQAWIDHQVYELEGGALGFNWDAIEAIFPKGMLDDMFDSYCRLLHNLAQSENAWNKTQTHHLLPRHRTALIENTNTPEAKDTGIS